MLLKTHIKDFQSLHDIEIEHGGLTVLTGQSDLGKSAVIRAMSMLHRNDGVLSDIRHGKLKIQIEQTFDSGNVLSIEKSKTVNSYHVNDKTLAKVGRDVPETVREILNTDKLILDKDLTCDLNFSGQFDPQFLLTESSTMVTKVISTLSGIEIIYSAIREGAAQAQKLKATSQVLAGNVSNLLKFEDLQLESIGLQNELDGLQSTENALLTQSKTIEKLAVLLTRCEILTRKIIDLENEEIELQSLVAEYKRLGYAHEVIKILESLKIRSDSVITPENFDVESLETLLGKIKAIYSVLTGDEIVYDTLKIRQKLINDFQVKLENAKKSISELEKEEAEIKVSIKICDKCGRPL